MPGNEFKQEGAQSVQNFGRIENVNIGFQSCCPKSKEWKNNLGNGILYYIAAILAECRSRDRIKRIRDESFGWLESESNLQSDFCCCIKLTEDLTKAEAALAFNVIVKLKSILKKNKVLQIVDLFTPVWVDQDDAGSLKNYASDSNFQNRSVSLSAKERWTADCYIGRAYELSFQHNLTIIEVTSPILQQADIEEQISEHFKQKRLPPDAVLRGMELRKRPVFLLFNSSYLPDRTLLNELRSKYSSITFFILTGNATTVDQQYISSITNQLRDIDADKERDLFSLYMSTICDVDS